MSMVKAEKRSGYVRAVSGVDTEAEMSAAREVLPGVRIAPQVIETAAGKVEFDLTEGEGPVVLASHGGLGGVPPPPVRGVSGWQSQYRTRELSVRWKQLIRRKMHGMYGHGMTHFDERPAVVALSGGRRRAVLAMVV
jgi:hypothetical protein